MDPIDQLDRLLSDSMHALPGTFRPPPGAREAFVGRLRRRRAGRRLAAASFVVVLAVVGLGVATLNGGSTTPGPSASAPAGGSSATRIPTQAPSVAPAVRPPSPITPPSSGGPESSTPRCAQIQVDGGPRLCAGSITAGNATGPAAVPLNLTVGERVTVTLPPTPGVTWGPPAAATDPSGVVLRAPPSGPNALATGPSATFVASGPGSVELTAVAVPECRRSLVSCPASGGEQWSLPVTVGRPSG